MINKDYKINLMLAVSNPLHQEINAVILLRLMPTYEDIKRK